MPIRPPVFVPRGMPTPEQRKLEYEQQRRQRQWRAWYGTARWKKRRADQLIREPLCRRCLSAGLIVAATVANHIVPHRGDATLFWESAIESLCARCHNSVVQSEEAGGGKKLK
jgi:5-methylcytosine-specific restriction protein A